MAEENWDNQLEYLQKSRSVARHQGMNYHTLYPELAAWAFGTVQK
jgi:hypothetical protein